ncbi:MAG: hypothetical protein HOQ12_09540 [Gemmatimonadaceae bacterium]|nr:hypothetical protein [Gemmatimonadaceae bacterium]
MPRLALLITTLALACAELSSPVEWRDARARDADALPGRLALRGDSVAFVADTLAAGVTLPAGACPRSARVAWSGASGVERYVVWWAPRPDSSAALMSARSVDGGRSWAPAEPVDTVDRSTVGCERPAPAVAADSASGYVHVAYSMRDAQGAGVFFSHSMEHGHMYHSPVAIMYGDALREVDVASLGDTVAVAFVQPTRTRSELGVALSRTMGHIFEDRVTVPASGDATDPAVALAPGRIAVAWVQRAPESTPVLLTRIGARPAPTTTR